MIEARRSNGGVVLVAMLVGLGAIATAFFARRMNRTSTEIDNLRAELSTVQNRDRLPPVVIQQVRAEPNRQEASPVLPQLESTAAASQVPKPTREERDEYLRLLNEARLDLCARTFGDEPKDPAWSEAAARLIRDKYSGQEYGVLAVTTDCRSTMCKVEFSYSDPAAGPAAVEGLMSNHPWPGQQFTNFNLETKQGVAYVSREGSTLPQVKVPFR